jgi:hypothetical protein
MRGVDTFLAFKEQADLKTPATLASLASGDFLAFNSESLSGRQQVIQSRAIRRMPMRQIAYSANGTVEAGGTVEFTTSNYVLKKLLPLIFHSKTGQEDDPDGAGATFTLVNGGVLTPFTAFVGFDGPEGKYVRRFYGAKVNQATFSARVNDMLNLNLDVQAIGKDILQPGDAGWVNVTPVYPGGTEEYAYVFYQARVLIKAGDMVNLAELPVESFDVTINHNLNTNRYRLGSIYRQSLDEGVTEVTGTFTLDAAAKSISGPALNLTGGSSHDPAFLEKVALYGKYAALRLEFVDPTREVAPGVPCKLTIDLPFVRLEEPDFQVRDPGVITGSARFIAYETISVNHVATF